MEKDGQHKNGFRLPEKDKPNPYHVPDGYFDKLTDRVMGSIRKEKKNVVRIFYFRPVFMYAASIAATLIILLTTVLYIARPGSGDNSELYVSLYNDSGYIDNIIVYEISNSEFYELAGVVGETDLYTEDVFADLTNEDIISYLTMDELNPYEIIEQNE